MLGVAFTIRCDARWSEMARDGFGAIWRKSDHQDKVCDGRQLDDDVTGMLRQ